MSYSTKTKIKKNKIKLTRVFLAYRGVSATQSIIIDEAISICDVLRDLVTFVQFKKREKHPWRSVTFSKVAGI